MSAMEMRFFNILIDNKQLFQQPMKNKQESYEKPVEMPKKWWLYTRKLIKLLVQAKAF